MAVQPGSGATWLAELAARDLNLLVALAALLEERHVTRAGVRMGLTQSAMSGLLARLRRQFDDELLVRVGNDLRLTPLAESLLPVTRDALIAVQRALAVGRRFDPAASSRTFVVAVSDYAQAVLTRPLLDRLEARAPSVTIDFRPIPAGLEHDPELVLRQHDVVIIPNRYLQTAARYSLPLFSDDLVFVVSSDHPDLVGGALPEGALDRLPLLGVSLDWQAVTMMTLVDEGLADRGWRRPGQIRTHSYGSVPYLLAGTRMLGVLPRRLAALCGAAGLLTTVGTTSAGARFTESAFWHSARDQDPGVEWLRQTLAAVAAQLD